MGKALIVHDPYRNEDTTITAFAKAEGVHRYAVSHYHWSHRTLEGFRDRPLKGKGLKPHTYTHNGSFIAVIEAMHIAHMSWATLNACRRKYGVNDIDEIRRRYDAEREKRRQAFMVKVPDGRLVTIGQFAKEQGVSRNTVACWLHRKGSLKGFSKRGHSRINPTLYRHTGLGMAKSARKWAEYFHCSKECIKKWLYDHDRDLAGFEDRRTHERPLIIYFKGKKRSVKEWAQVFGVTRIRLYNYYRRNHSLKGFDPKMKQGRPPKAA